MLLEGVSKMKDNKKLIGQRIKIRREELGMTQEDLGNILWLNKSTIQRYESGKVERIKVPVLHAMSKALNVNPDWLALKTDNMGNFSENYNFTTEEEINSSSNDSPQLNDVYFSLAKSAQEEGIDPDDIKLAIETIKAMRNKKDGD